MTNSQAEPTVAINPANPSVMVVFAPAQVAGGGLFEALSADGGTTWTQTIIAATNAALPYAGFADECATFDKFGNLFLSYLTANAGGSTPTNVAILYSADNGANFTVITTNAFDELYGVGYLDQPWITTGPSGTAAPYSVWVSYADEQVDAYGHTVATTINACGASVNGLGQVGNFGTRETIAVPGSAVVDYTRIAVGPSGQVMCAFQSADTVFCSVDPDGLGTSVFPTATTVTNQKIGFALDIPAAPKYGIDAAVGLAWDRSGGQHNGREKWTPKFGQ